MTYYIGAPHLTAGKCRSRSFGSALEGAHVIGEIKGWNVAKH